MYAIITTDDHIAQLVDADTDEQAQEHFRRHGLDSRNGVHPRLVALDLGADETPHVGDHVEVDDDGVATLA